MADTESVVGVWAGSAFPTHETTIILCDDGQGLLFFYWGSEPDTPFVDEFEWAPAEDGRLRVVWRVCHEHVYPDEEDELGEAQDAEQPLQVTSGGVETPRYQLTHAGRVLELALGDLGSAFYDEPLEYIRAPRSFEEERQRLQERAANFDPFGPERSVWFVQGGRWRAIGAASDDEEQGEAPRARDGGWTQLAVLPYFLGVLGQFTYLSHYPAEDAPLWQRLPVCLMPLPGLLVGLPEWLTGTPASCRLRCIGAWWFLVVTALVLGIAGAGLRPRGWRFYLLLVALAIYPYARVAWTSRRAVKAE